MDVSEWKLPKPIWATENVNSVSWSRKNEELEDWFEEEELEDEGYVETSVVVRIEGVSYRLWEKSSGEERYVRI